MDFGQTEMEEVIAGLHGVYAAVPTAWDNQGRFDAATFRENLARLIDAGVHGVYTTGTDGEWYALEFDEFCRMVDAFAAEVVDRAVGSQVGCTWINTDARHSGGAGSAARVAAVERGRCSRFLPGSIRSSAGDGHRQFTCGLLGE